MQKIAQALATSICKLSPSNKTLRRNVKTFRQRFFDLRPKSFHGPFSISKGFGDLDSNSRPVAGFKECLEQGLAHLFTGFSKRVDSCDPHVVIIVRQKLAQNGGDLGRDMPAHGANEI